MWRFLLVIPVSLSLMVSCGEKNFPGTSAEFDAQDAKEDSLILRVKDNLYFNRDLELFLQLSIGKEYKNLSPVSLSRLFDNFADEMILLDAAQEQETTLTWDEKKKYLAKLSNDSFLEENRTLLDEGEQDFVFKRLRTEKYIYSMVKDIEVSDDEIEEYYNQHKREYLLPERVKVSQILLPNEEKAVEILKELENASAEDFKRIAKIESIGVESSKGGEMGVFAMGQLPYEMDKVVFSLKEGEISPVLESFYGFHIFRIDAKFEPELVPRDNAASSIRVKILSQKIKDCISQHTKDLKNTIEWDIYPQNLYFPYQRISDE